MLRSPPGWRQLLPTGCEDGRDYSVLQPRGHQPGWGHLSCATSPGCAGGAQGARGCGGTRAGSPSCSPCQSQESRGVYNYFPPLAVHLFISSNIPGLEKVFEQEPPPQQMAGGNVNTPHTQQWWELCAAPRAGSQLCLPSQHPKPPRFCKPDAVFLFLFSPTLLFLHQPGVLRAPGALLGGLEAVSGDGKNRSLMEFDFSGSLFLKRVNVPGDE